MVNKCKNCGKEINYFSPSQIYCSKDCVDNRKENSFNDLFSSLFTNKK